MSTTLSVVQTANRFPLGAQHIAVTFTMPSEGCVIDFTCFSCMVIYDFVSNPAAVLFKVGRLAQL
jgi:hypothetical protein